MPTEEQTLPQVRLRAIEPEDLDLLYKVENDVGIWCVGPTNVPYSRYTLHSYIAESSCDIYTDRQVRLIIEDTEARTIGMVDLVNFDPKHCRAEVGIIIQKQFRNKGFAHAAMRKIVNYAHSVLHLHQLYAIVDQSNSYSVKLFQSLGFHCNMCLKDWLFDGDDYNDALVMQYFL